MSAGRRVAWAVFGLAACKHPERAASDAAAVAPAASDAAPAAPVDAAPSASAAHVQTRGPLDVCATLRAYRGHQPTAPAAPTSEPCKSLSAAHASRVARATATCPGGAGSYLATAARGAFRCEATKEGAWATTFATLAPDAKTGDPGTSLAGRLTIGWYDTTGKLVASAAPGAISDHEPSSYASPTSPTGENFRIEAGSEETRVTDFVVFDWDGDGTPEVFLRMSKKYEEAGRWYRGVVWTSKGGVVTEYAPTSRTYPTAVLDADGDGRPDVYSPFPFMARYLAGGIVAEQLAEGPLLLAHSLDDGTFAFDDAVAKDGARCACPARAEPFALPPGLGEAWTAIACARIRGASPAALHAAIGRACTTGDAAAPSDACEYRKLLDGFADASPRVHLP